MVQENAASVPTLKGGGHYGHTALTMDGTTYATLPHTVPFVTTVAPGELVFPVGTAADAQDDAKLLYLKRVYNFELESNITTAL